ncbi:MAG TPA: hypothetical protein VJT31_13650 [Rugosimonospora sp.]|nr:hypothetical protein [Rugosimonospora sp.]
MTGVEDRLRALFQADAEQIQQADLRPAATFPPLRARRTGWLPVTAAVLSVAAATAAILVGPHLFRAPAPAPTAPGPAGAAAMAAAPLTVTFGTRTTTVSPPGVSVVVPVPAVTAADPQAAPRVSGVIDASLADAVTAFRNRSDAGITFGSSARAMSERITVADTATWHHYLSVRFDTSMEVGQEHPLNESFALTFDTATGARVLSTDLFTDISRTTAVVRGALLASRTDGSLAGFDLATVSLRPSEAGTTTPLTCYPAPAGLRCLVDQGSLAPFAAGRIEATVPWDQLTSLLRPGTSN